MGWSYTQNLNTNIVDIDLNQSILVTGVIADLPESPANKSKFIFLPIPSLRGGELNFLGMAKKNAPTHKPVTFGNNGYQNLDEFDYKQIGATGCVKPSEFD